MSKRLIKTILSPALMTLMLFLTIFSVSAETFDQRSESGKSVSDNDKRISTFDEEDISTAPSNIFPTMKPAYYNPVNRQSEVDKSQSNRTLYNNSSSTKDENPTDSRQSAVAVPETGAKSKISTSDTGNATPDFATPDETTTKGVVNTGDTSVSVFVLLTLISLSSLLIGIHKKELTE